MEWEGVFKILLPCFYFPCVHSSINVNAGLLLDFWETIHNLGLGDLLDTEASQKEGASSTPCSRLLSSPEKGPRKSLSRKPSGPPAKRVRPTQSGPGNIFSSSTRAASVSSPSVSWEQGRTEPPVQLALDGGDVAAVGDQGDEDGAVEVEGENIAAVEVEAKALSAKRAFKICPVCDQKIDKKIPQENLLIYRQSKDLPGEAQVPGSVSNVKRAFSHTQADKEGHNFYANENLLKVDCRSPL